MSLKTGYTDNGNREIYVGDHMTVPEHDNKCCQHWIRCEIKWNKEWKQYGMQAKDGRWISGMGIAGGYSVESKINP